MEKQFIKATRRQLIENMKAENISRRTDTMEPHRRFQYFLLDAAKKAASSPGYKRARTLIDCRVYVTNRPGAYGHQYLAAVWVSWTGSGTKPAGPSRAAVATTR
jgi:hypothetical protein